MVVLVTATVSLTWASRQVISARHEQFRRSREDSLQRMLAAGSEWLAAGGAASLPTEPGATLRLPLPDEDAASSIDKVVLWQREPAGTFRVTARWIRAASRPERAASAERTASTEPGVLAEKVRRGIRLPSAPRPRPAGTLKTNVLSAAEGEPE